MKEKKKKKKSTYISINRFFVVMTDKTDPCCVDDSFKGYCGTPIVLVNTLDKFLKECLEIVESHLNPVQYFIP